nr:hypothetical protein [Tanacetum cinerariifolium]
MRMEQYFLMTDYSLWDVILNGDSHVPTIVVDGCYDWSYQEEDEPANFALMSITSSSSSSENESSKKVTSPRTSVQPAEAPILDATLKPSSPKSNRRGKRKNRKTCFVCRSVDHLIKDCDYHTKKKAQPTPRNYVHRGNVSYLSDFKELNSGYVAFGGNPKGGKISSKGKIKTGKLDFEDVYFVRELKFNLFSVLQMCDKKNSVLSTDTECLVLSPDFKLPDESQVRLRVPRENNRVLVTKPHNKTPNELLHGLTLSIGFMRPFGCLVTILNTLDPLAKFKRKNKEGDVAFDAKEYDVDTKKPESSINVSPSSSAQSGKQDDKTKKKAKGKSPVESFTGNRDLSVEFEDHFDNSSNDVNAAGSIVLTVGKNSSNSTNPFSAAGPSNITACPTHGKSSLKDASQLPDNLDMLEDITYFDDENVGAKTEFNNLETSITVSPIPTTRIHKDHPVSQIIGDLSSNTQTRSMTRVIKDQGGLSLIFNDDFYTCMVIGTKWVYRNKNDERGIVVKNNARLVVQGHTQEEGIYYEEVFAPVARIEAIRLFLAYTSFMGFMVYQMDIKSAFLYGTIEEEVYVCQPLWFEEEVYVCQPSLFEDLNHPNKVYKVVKALYGLHQAPRAWYETLANYLLENGFHRGKIDQTLFIKKKKGDTLLVKRKKDGIFINQDKYVAEILRKYGLTKGKSASTPIDTEKPLLKDPNDEDVDVHTYRSMLGSLMYLTSSRPDIMFASDASEGFNQVINFLNGSHIKYALTVNPHIYMSCIKQFWNTVVVKQTNDVTRLQALVDRKKVVIMEDTIRDALRLDDAEGVDCLPNEEIFAELARIGYEKPSTKLTLYKAFFSSQWKFLIHTILQSMSAKRTSWNEFSSAMASTVICMSTGRKFNFSKYILESLVRNVNSSSEFYMYHRFIQLIIKNQLGDLSTHTTKYISPALTQKVFANMKRVGKGLSGVETPLFEGMLVAGVIEEEGAAEEQVLDIMVDDAAAHGVHSTVQEDDAQEPSIPSPTPPTPPPQPPQDLPSTSQVQHSPP